MKNSSTSSFGSRRFASLGIALFVLTAIFLTALTRQAGAQTYSLSNVWNVAAGTDGLSSGSDGGNRGLAYSAISNQVFVAYRAGSSNLPIEVFDGTAGTYVSGSAGVTGSLGLNCDQIGVGDDGILYGCPLNTSVTGTSAFKIYSWTNWNSSPYLCFSNGASDAIVTAINGTRRIGDSLAVTGSGVNTRILALVGSSSAFALFSTTDGINFTSTVLTNTTTGSLPNVSGLCFYTNNTFIVKGSGVAYLVQYPSNFASLPSPVTATVLGSASLSGTTGDTSLSYSSAGQLLGATSQSSGSSGPVNLYSLTNFPASANSLSSTSFTTTSGNNGNETGGTALGGTGKTNYLYAMGSDNGLHAYQIIFTVAPVAPIITTQPINAIGAYPPQTLTITETGTMPITNLWYSNTTSNNTGGTLVQSSTNTSYTVTAAVTNYYYVIATNAAGRQTSSVVELSLKPLITNSVVSKLFSVSNGASGFSYLANDDNTRGIAYDTVTGRLIVANKTGGPNLYLVDGTTGTNIGTLNTTGMTIPGGETFTVDQVGVADDGVVYACNLAASAGSFVITSWSSATTNATAYQAWGGGLGAGADPGSGSGDRWGDTMAVRGAGVNTQILIAGRNGSGPGTNVVLFTTPDGSNFTQNLLIPVPGVTPGFAQNGLAFGAGNTFWGKRYTGDLVQIAFDPTGASNASVLLDYAAGSQVPGNMSGVGIDSANAIFGGVDLADQNNDLQLFQLTGNSNAPVLFDQAEFPNYVSGDNGNDLAVVSMKYPRVYALSVDNGIIGLTYGVPASTAPTITSNTPVGATIYTAITSYSITPTVSGTLPLYYQWQYNTVSNLATVSNISGATGGSYTFSSPSTNASGWYDVVVTNFGGKATSAAVQMTILAPVTSPSVTNLWTLSPGSRPYLDSSTFGSRGLAYDTNTGYLLVSDHLTTNIYVLNGADGSDAFQMGPFSGLTNGTFPLNLVAVADDGTVYFANLAITQSGGGGDTFQIYAAPSATGSFNPTPVFSGDPGNGAGERWGDSIAIRGSGTNTQILLGSYGQGEGPGTNVALLTTSNGSTFTALTIPVSGPTGGFSGAGIAFGAGNTFWAKGGHNFDLRQVSFDPTGATPAVVLQDYTAATQIPNDLPGIAVDVANNILGGVEPYDIPADFQLYELSASNPPTLFNQSFFVPGTFVDNQDNAQAVLKYPGFGVSYGVGFALGVNNGIVAVTYNPPLLPFSVTATDVPGTGVVLSWPSLSGHSYAVRSRSTLVGSSWSTNSFLPGTGGTMYYTNSSPSGTSQFYGVIGQ